MEKITKIFASSLKNIGIDEYEMESIDEMATDSVFCEGDVGLWLDREEPDVDIDISPVSMDDLDKIKLSFGDLKPEDMHLVSRNDKPIALYFAADVSVDTMTDMEILHILEDSNSWNDGVSAELLAVLAERHGLDARGFETNDDLYDVILGRKDVPRMYVTVYKDSFSKLFPEECDEDGQPMWDDNTIDANVPEWLWICWVYDNWDCIIDGLDAHELQKYRNSNESLPNFFYSKVYTADDTEDFIDYCVAHGFKAVRDGYGVKFE